MITDWQQANKDLSAALATYRQTDPDVAAAFTGLGKAATKPGALDQKTKELIALAIGIAARCDGCIGFHTETVINLGASREEVIETIGMATYMGGGPSYVYGAQALLAFDQRSGKG